MDTIHATTVAVSGRAVILRGASGSGKSGLALQLIALGAELVADDRTRLWRKDKTVWADAPEAIRGQIEARGVGILNAAATGRCPVALVVEMDETETTRLPERRKTNILDVAVPVMKKSDAPHFPAALILYLRGDGLT